VTGVSARAEIAERIASFIREHELERVFGGEAVRLDGDRFYHVLCSVPRTLDGIVKVYGPKFIQVQLQGQLVHGEVSAVFESEQAAVAFLKALLVDHDDEAAFAVPQKARAA
jgi:hypothetical protein